jgi:hypothetical protein
MTDRPAHCEAELVLVPVTICDLPTAVWFKLSKPFVPKMMGPALPGRVAVDACEGHADQIERVLTRAGHEPQRRKS